MNRRLIALVAVATALVTLPSLAGAAPKPKDQASCIVSQTIVNAVGLPTDQVINFLISDGNGTTGWVLGYTSDGTWSVAVPAASGATAYQFVSRTRGPNGSKYTVFASCS